MKDMKDLLPGVSKGSAAKVRKLGLLIVVSAGVVAVYIACIRAGADVISLIYSIIASLLIIAFFIINRGIDSKPIPEDQLREGLSEEKKRDYYENFDRRHRTAVKLLFPLIPMLLVLIFDWASMFF